LEYGSDDVRIGGREGGGEGGRERERDGVISGRNYWVSLCPVIATSLITCHASNQMIKFFGGFLKGLISSETKT